MYLRSAKPMACLRSLCTHTLSLPSPLKSTATDYAPRLTVVRVVRHRPGEARLARIYAASAAWPYIFPPAKPTGIYRPYDNLPCQDGLFLTRLFPVYCSIMLTLSLFSCIVPRGMRDRHPWLDHTRRKTPLTEDHDHVRNPRRQARQRTSP